MFTKIEGMPLKHMELLQELVYSLTQIAIPYERFNVATFPHIGALNFVYYNKYFAPIVAHDTEQALRAHQMHYDSDIQPLSESDNDVVIHLRCGDIYRAHTTVSGFMTVKYYILALQESEWMQSRIQNTSANATTTVWIQSQLGSNSARWAARKQKDIAECATLVNGVAEYMNALWSKYNTIVRVSGNGTITHDWYRMVHAPLLICGMSTFWLHAAIANINGTVVMPRWGPWKYNHVMDDNNNNKDFLPSNHIIINTSRTSLDLCVTSKYKIHKQWSAEQLLNHLIS